MSSRSLSDTLYTDTLKMRVLTYSLTILFCTSIRALEEWVILIDSDSIFSHISQRPDVSDVGDCDDCDYLQIFLLYACLIDVSCPLAI